MSEIKYNLCACMGAMYGEPYCYCVMQQNGLQDFMDNNPLRKAEEERAKKQWDELVKSGFFDRYEED